MSGIFKTWCSGLFLTNLSRTSIPQIQGKFKLPQPLIIATFYSSYEQTNIFLYACAATVIAAIIFSKGSPYRQPLYRNGGQNHKMLHRSKCCLFLCSSHNFASLCSSVIMSIWAVAAIATVFFMSLYKSQVSWEKETGKFWQLESTWISL